MGFVVIRCGQFVFALAIGTACQRRQGRRKGHLHAADALLFVQGIPLPRPDSQFGSQLLVLAVGQVADVELDRIIDIVNRDSRQGRIVQFVHA